MHCEKGLPGSRPTLDYGRARARHAAAQHRIETGNPCGVRARWARSLAIDRIRAAHPWKEGQSGGPDLEEVTARHVVGTAELHDLDFAHRAQLLMSI